ncbi:MAG: hypothetical protein BLM47_11230 [Candidatus Reconcilbacillus cellulovorans]|uniref:Uncharacterized protein n=1 Tax=Candidatus Reconcilbacillus cellulovorans TaxID=1906605 RepID=A0A2A6DYA4_9BACL|nr:MAG: hypothetical protein BLM47_11230 [Candidatus Reconcilbacillus cellulovorans]
MFHGDFLSTAFETFPRFSVLHFSIGHGKSCPKAGAGRKTKAGASKGAGFRFLLSLVDYSAGGHHPQPSKYGIQLEKMSGGVKLRLKADRGRPGQFGFGPRQPADRRRLSYF